MCKREAVVDTCFLEKISNSACDIDNLKRVINEYEIIPVVHPYIAKHALSLKAAYVNLLDEGYIFKKEYSDFIKDESSKVLYEGYYKLLYEELRRMLEAEHNCKAERMLLSFDGIDIYEHHKQGSSLGDVHMILMAAYMHLPIILTKDSDIEALRDIAKRHISFRNNKLEIYDSMDIIVQIASNPNCGLSWKDMKHVLDVMQERSHREEIHKIWNNRTLYLETTHKTK